MGVTNTNMSIHTCIRTYVRVCVCEDMHVRARKLRRTRTHIGETRVVKYMNKSIDTYVCAWVRAHICMYVRSSSQTGTQTHAHTHRGETRGVTCLKISIHTYLITYIRACVGACAHMNVGARKLTKRVSVLARTGMFIRILRYHLLAMAYLYRARTGPL